MPDTPPPAAPRVVIVNWALLAVGLVNLAVGTYYVIRGEVAIATLGLGSGLALLLASTVERFESIKGAGVEVKTRQLEQKIEQADEVLAKLRDMTEAIAPVLVHVQANVGRVKAVPTAETSYQFSRTMRRVLEVVGAPPARIREALTPWAEVLAFDVTQGFVEEARCKGRMMSGEPDAMLKSQAFFDSFPGADDWRLDRYVSWWSEHRDTDIGLQPEDAKAFRERRARWLEEFRWLQEHLDLREPAQWFKASAEFHARPLGFLAD